MNELAQFSGYVTKVFALGRIVRGVRSHRPYPEIPTRPLLLSLLLGVVIRAGSYLDISKQTKRRRWQPLIHWRQRISDDAFHYVSERFYLEDLRQSVAEVNQRLKANKALESCKINGLLFVSVDATSTSTAAADAVRAAAKGRSQKSAPKGKNRRSSNITIAMSSLRSTVPSSTRCWTWNRFVQGKGKPRRLCACWAGFAGFTACAFSTRSPWTAGMCKAPF